MPAPGDMQLGSAAQEEAMADRIGTQVGHYRLTTLLGQGGFAEVYLGEHVHLGTQTALKLLHAPLAQAEQVEAFRQEARRIAQLSHPHIVRVLDFGFEGELPYLVLEYAPGGNLRQRHPVGAVVPLSTVLTYVGQIAQGLQYAHDQQVIHRDLKPQNFLLGRGGEVLLADFGISVVAASTSRQSSKEFAGTVAYAAPEQIQGHPRPASDQYALSIVVYEWLTGQLPFTGGLSEVIWKQLQAAPPALRARVPTLSAAIEQVVLKALAKDPQQRFSTVQAFVNAFAQACQAAPQPSRPAATLTQAPATQWPPQTATPPPTQTPPSIYFATTQPTPAPTTPPALGASTRPTTPTPPLLPAPPLPTPMAVPPARALPPPSTLVPTAGSGSNSILPASRTPAAPPVTGTRSTPPSKQRRGRTGLLVGLVLVLLVGGSLIGVLLANPRPTGPGVMGSSTAAPTATATPSPPGVVTEFPLAPPAQDPSGIAAGPDGNVWFTERGIYHQNGDYYTDGKIGRITRGGAITEFPLPTSQGEPVGITPGQDGNLWFTENAGNRIGRITPQGMFTEFPIPRADSKPFAITSGPDGNLWFIEHGGCLIGRITVTGTITQFQLSSCFPFAITPGPDGNLWFTMLACLIGRITLAGDVTQFTLPQGCGVLGGITEGPDGNLWYADFSGNQIGRITTSGVSTQFQLPHAQSDPTEITLGSDGNLWFTEQNGGMIGRISRSGTITEFPVNGPPYWITSGPDDNLWFTESDANQIGRITSGKQTTQAQTNLLLTPAKTPLEASLEQHRRVKCPELSWLRSAVGWHQETRAVKKRGRDAPVLKVMSRMFLPAGRPVTGRVDLSE